MAEHAIVIDCDPGQDDAMALLLALGSPDEIEVIAVTAVCGNVPLALTSRNARQIVELAGREDVPVHAGCARPLLKPLETAEYVHGASGLNGVVLPDATIPLAAEHAVDAIVRTVNERPPGRVSIAALGPLTNVALAIVKEPGIVPRLREIVLMGGAIGLGNVTPAAEFNIFVDPHAASIVFESGVPITMLGLDVTHQALVDEDRLARIRGVGGRLGEACGGMLEFFNRFDRQRYETPGAPLHDPCTIAWLIAPELFSGKRCRVAIETEGRHTAGRTVVDWWPREAQEPNALVIDKIDADGFFELLIARLACLAGS